FSLTASANSRFVAGLCFLAMCLLLPFYMSGLRRTALRCFLLPIRGLVLDLRRRQEPVAVPDHGGTLDPALSGPARTLDRPARGRMRGEPPTPVALGLRLAPLVGAVLRLGAQ